MVKKVNNNVTVLLPLSLHVDKGIGFQREKEE